MMLVCVQGCIETAGECLLPGRDLNQAFWKLIKYAILCTEARNARSEQSVFYIFKSLEQAAAMNREDMKWVPRAA